MKIKNRVFILIAVLNVLFCSFVYAKSVNEELSDNLLRLHIIANSDSEYDQNIKLQVRDEILKITGDKKYETKQKVIDDLKNVEESLNMYLENENVEYSANVIHTKTKFDKRNYEKISMPSGEYECIRVVLGNGNGKNWWCVAYPPLCFTKSVLGGICDENKEKLKNQLSSDTYNTILKNGVDFQIRFKTVDLLNSIIDIIS